MDEVVRLEIIPAVIVGDHVEVKFAEGYRKLVISNQRPGELLRAGKLIAGSVEDLRGDASRRDRVRIGADCIGVVHELGADRRDAPGEREARA